ncbi:MAG: LysR family transcriptional regulator [Hyphomicrobiales bacterium]
MFEFKDIEILHDIVKAGGFRAAARKYDLSQSAISSRIAALEKTLGIVLFDRSNRQVRLTAAGRRFIEESRRLLDARSRIWQDLTHPNGLSGTVRIGVAETVVHTLATDLLETLKTSHRGLRFELLVDVSGELAGALEGDRIDVGIMLRESVPQGATATPLKPVRLGWYCAQSAVLPDHPLSPVELAEYEIMTFSRGTAPFREVESVFSSPDISPPNLHGSASLLTIKHLVAAGFGIGVLPIPVAESNICDCHVKAIAVGDEAKVNDLYFAVVYFPERNREIGETVAKATRLFDR